MKVLVSACLLGRNCKYNGGNNYNGKVADFVKDKEVVEICPELLAGFPAPRPPVELAGGTAVNICGENVDRQFRRGVETAMERISGLGIELAVLQPRSPTCGVKQIYDGSFSGRLIDGQGLFAQALLRAGYRVIGADELQSGPDAVLGDTRSVTK